MATKAKKVTTFKPVKREPGELATIPATPKAPKPSQPKLPGFSTPELEEIEGISEAFARVQDRVKSEQKKLKIRLEREEERVIKVMQKYNRTSLVIGGYTIQIFNKVKAHVKGLPAPKEKKKEDEEKKPTRTKASKKSKEAAAK